MDIKTLFLFRHAKSSWDEPLEDRDRPLGRRGRRAAPAMAERMKVDGLIPDHVLCSPATRTRQTWELMAPILGPDIPVSYHDSIYDDEPEDVLELVRGVGDPVDTVMVIGHNPTIAELARTLAGEAPVERLTRMRKKFPTAALAVLEFQAMTWREVGPRGGTLTRFLRPKDLLEADERGL